MKVSDILQNRSTDESIAIIDSLETYTYKELHEKSKRISNKLISSGLSCSKVVGILLDNSCLYAVAYFGVLYSDKTIAPFNPQLTVNELANEVKYCECDVLITSKKYYEKASSLLGNLEFKCSILFIDTLDFLSNNSVIKLSTFHQNKLNDVPIILHTSGTTNKPKRVMLTDFNLISNIKSNIESLNINNKDIVLIALPMYFGYCNTAQFLSHLYLGAKVVIMDYVFTPRKFFELTSNYKITNFTAVPTMLVLIDRYSTKRFDQLKTLKFICFGGGIISIEILKRLIKNFPKIDFIQTYGQTEASPRITLANYSLVPNKIGSVGKEIPNVKVEIISNDGNELAPNNNGQLVIQGPNVMKGYYKNDVETEKTIVEKRLFTGDIGYRDEEGFIYITGRLKNIVICGGINIYPEEIESVVMEIDGVCEARISGQKDKLLGEIPVLDVVTTVNVSEQEIIMYCRSKLSNYKLPRKINFVDAFEKTYNGKLKRR